MNPMATDKLTILHTNDIHSHFEMMSANAAVISRERNNAEDGAVLVLDIGDHMDRAAAETEGTKGQANVDVINLTGYDAITIGNNEGLTVSTETLEAVYAGLQCPVICCNIKESTGGKPPVWMKERLVIERKGIKIGLTGATAAFTSFYKLLGWEAEEPAAAIAKQVELLRGEADVVVVMSHLGINADKSLAQQVPAIDVILGGHTHHVLEEPLVIGDTVVCGAGKFGNYVGKVVLEREHAGTPFVCTSGECIPVERDEIDPGVEQAIQSHRMQAEDQLREQVAVTDRSLSIDYEQESPFANLLAQAVRHFTGTGLAIVNSGQLLGPLPAGEISIGMLHALCPSPINPCVVRLKGAEIIQALEESLSSEFYHKEIRGFGFRGKVLGVLALDGAEVVYDEQRPEGDRIRQVSIEGVPIRNEDDYTVGTLDMFTFKIGYTSLANGRDIVYMLPELLRDLLREELSRPGALQESFKRRWRS